jgi:hypothetical protein
VVRAAQRVGSVGGASAGPYRSERAHLDAVRDWHALGRDQSKLDGVVVLNVCRRRAQGGGWRDLVRW